MHINMITKERNKNVLLHIVKLAFTCLVTVCFALVWHLYYAEKIHTSFGGKEGYVIIGAYFVIYIFFAKLYGGFQVGITRISELFYSQVVALFMTAGAAYILIWLLIGQIPEPMPVLIGTLCELALAVLWCWAANRLHNCLFPPKRTIVVYEGMEALDSIGFIGTLPWKFQVTSVIPVKEDLADLLEHVKCAEAVFVCGVTSTIRNELLKYCTKRGIPVYLRPKIGDLLVSGAKRMHISHVPVLYCARSNVSGWYLAAKRGVDFFTAFAALAVLWPLMALTALATKLYDKGPVFYKQCRLTKDGKRFEILKFRSMRPDAERDGVARLASKHDDRITPIGKVIRMIRFDELPQLLNILKGDMSLVGPRPERPEIAAEYCREMPEFDLRLQVKAGLTGYAQVHGRYNSTPYDKLQMDLMYIADQSLTNDLKIMMMTVKILFMPESTEGVEKERITAGSLSE